MNDARPPRSEAAERVLLAARQVFSEKGYDGSNIADIQIAAGLAPGSGAMYKHFPSKEALLREIMEDFIAEARRGQAEIERLPADPGVALRALGVEVLASLRRDRQLLQIVWRDLSRFPDLRDAVRDERMQRAFRVLADWLDARLADGSIQVGDTEATAAVMLSALTMYPVFEALLGAAPGGVDEDRFLSSWVQLVSSGLQARSSG